MSIVVTLPRDGRSSRRVYSSTRTEARMAQGARARFRELPASEECDDGAAAPYRLRRGPLSQHRRVLASRHGDVHDSRRRVYARLCVLRGRAWKTPRARSRGTGARSRCDRDDVADGGAFIFAETIRRIRERVAGCRIEVLIPDFQGLESSLRTVLDAGPDVLNHNIETVPRLYRMARSGGKYTRSLELLDRSRRYRPLIATKTGIMVGLGESVDEVVAVLEDLRHVGVSILTIGQYLRPSLAHAPMTRYYHPDEFADLKHI